jgi:hypothetical protein
MNDNSDVTLAPGTICFVKHGYRNFGEKYALILDSERGESHLFYKIISFDGLLGDLGWSAIEYYYV